MCPEFTGKVFMIRKSLLAVTVLVSSAAAPAFAASAPDVHLRGTVVATSAASFDVETAAGVVHVPFSKTKTTVAQIIPSSRAAIKPNTFVGIASNGDAPGAAAREVVVFPEAARGMGEGHYGWDLPAGGNTMTNGSVAARKSMMTNGSVGAKSGSAGPMTITVTYKGGSNRITVPASAPIVTFAPGSPAMLVKGAHVVVFAPGPATAPGQAAFVFVGKGSLVPPM